ncbi:hypothetical protein [Erythrobacter sp. BLCC-B19]|uniref:hypothetical protein n=1 Tax=Erythrobacter sp. BLCC-B19 TaxID=3025315 RepID=UPI002362D856|nr:hypothetical protein [Erythrobacter sp. BLCC-B19]WDA42225.1 hypothetical protein PS060_05265 [Erythrobacter sp. BLCC-B19]
MAAGEPFVARFSPLLLFFWLALSAAMALLALKTVGPVLGSPALVFFGGIAAAHAIRLFDRRPQVIIDGGGLYIRSHGEKRIALRSIKSLHADWGRLSVTVHKPAMYPIERFHRRMIYRVNGSAARGFFGDAWIFTMFLDQPQTAIVEAIRAHRPQTEFERQLEERIAGTR